MKTLLATELRRCRVEQTPTDSFDFRVRWFSAESEEDVYSEIDNEGGKPYLNHLGENVYWDLIAVMRVEEWVDPRESGDELAGFIVSREDLEALLDGDVERWLRATESPDCEGT